MIRSNTDIKVSVITILISVYPPSDILELAGDKYIVGSGSGSELLEQVKNIMDTIRINNFFIYQISLF